MESVIATDWATIGTWAGLAVGIIAIVVAVVVAVRHHSGLSVKQKNSAGDTSQNLQAGSSITLGGTLGGGGGAIGPGAFGGRGGDISLFPEVKNEIKRSGVGAQAVNDAPSSPVVGAGHIIGFDGGDGGTTAIVSQDGEVIVAAGGGGGGFVGTGQRSKSEALAVSAIVLANAVEVRDGLAYMLRGGWQNVTCTQFPQDVRLVALVIIEAGGVPQGEYAVHMTASDTTGIRLGRTTFALTIEQVGQVLRLPWYVPLQCTLAGPGVYELEVSSDSASLSTIRLVVQVELPVG
jgi:hypothetical protein